ncbi:Karilysin [Tannerella forsythia]|nr:Karilysin [Tannerella forsythia]
MKKISCLLIFYLVISFSIKGQCDIRMYDIYTPKGSPVVTFLMCESSIEKRKSLDQYYAQRYPNAVQIKTYDLCSSTRKFNCHGYAWLRVEQNIDRWIGTGWSDDVVDPEKIYISDSSYTEVSQETYPGKVFWASGDHTAITTEQQGIFISKWNEWPLMKHAWNYSPFGSNNLKYYQKASPSPSISGPSSVCDQATYTVENLPQGATVQWSVSNNNVTLTSGQGTHTATFTKFRNGMEIIHADILFNNIRIALLTKETYFGAPSISNIIGEQRVPTGQYASYRAVISNNAPIPSSYQWILNPLNGNSLYGNGTESIDIAFYNPGSYQLVCRATNECGVGDYYTMGIGVYDNLYLTLSPNPATDVVTLQLTETDEVSGLSVLSTDRSAFEIQLWSGMRMLRSFRTNEPTFQISMAGLPAGLYFVRVVKNGQTYTQKLIKK